MHGVLYSNGVGCHSMSKEVEDQHQVTLSKIHLRNYSHKQYYKASSLCTLFIYKYIVTCKKYKCHPLLCCKDISSCNMFFLKHLNAFTQHPHLIKLSLVHISI